jgi:uncharacterized protein YecE (DUF72 family)
MAARHPIRIGCSGWNYRHWRGAFYPESLAARNWFAYYAERFDVVELNNSFYRLPSAETALRWREQAPPGFRYAIKANRYITQAKKLIDCAEPLARLLAPTRALGAALGPILFQLPPMLRLDLERLERFLALLPRDLVHVFEFRHASWYDEATLCLLDQFDAGFVTHDFPGLVSPRWASGAAAYVRFHGTSGKYRGRYSSKALKSWAGWLREQASTTGLGLFQQ